MFALLPIILSLAPQLAGLLFGSRGGDVATKVASIVGAVTGQDINSSDGAAAAVAAIQGKPELALQLQQRLAELHAEMQKELDRESDQQRADFLSQMKVANEDTASARAMAITGKGPMQWGAPIISLIVILLFAAKELGLDLMLASYFKVTLTADNGSIQLLYAAVTLVLGFWLGSSNGSQMKNEHIATLTNAIQNSVPIATAEKMLAAPSAEQATTTPSMPQGATLAPQVVVQTQAPSTDDLNNASFARAQGRQP